MRKGNGPRKPGSRRHVEEPRRTIPGNPASGERPSEIHLDACLCAPGVSGGRDGGRFSRRLEYLCRGDRPDRRTRCLPLRPLVTPGGCLCDARVGGTTSGRRGRLPPGTSPGGRALLTRNRRTGARTGGGSRPRRRLPCPSGVVLCPFRPGSGRLGGFSRPWRSQGFKLGDSLRGWVSSPRSVAAAARVRWHPSHVSV